MRRWQTMSLLVAVGWFLAAAERLPAGEKVGGGKQGPLVLVDAQGKEHTVKDWKFTEGTVVLPWQTEIKGKKSAPETLEFFEGQLPPLKKSVLAYLPLASVRSITFDSATATMTVRVARGAKEADDEILVGPTGYQGTNAVTVVGTVDDGGKAKDVEFIGGPKNGLRTIRFPMPQPIDPLPKGRVASVKHGNKKYPTLDVVDPQVLYAQNGAQVTTVQALYFNDPIKIELAKLGKLAQMRAGGNYYEVTQLNGQRGPKVLVLEPKGEAGMGALELVGFVGRFAAGYRFFPIVTVGELEFAKTEKK